MHVTWKPIFSAALCFALLGCGGGGSTTSSATTSGSIMIKDATYAQLGTFKVTFSKGVLVGASGTTNHTLFDTAQQVDLLTLQINSSFLASGDIPEGTYSGMLLTVSGITATDKSNNSLTFDGAANLPQEVPMDFAEPLTVVQGTPVEILLDFDVKRSYTETGATTFSMTPVVKPDPDPPAMEMGSIDVTILSKDSVNGTFLARTVNQPYRTFKVKVANTVPYVVNYTSVYLGTADVLANLTVGTKVTLDEGRFMNGVFNPFFIMKGGTSYPSNFAICGGTVTSVDTTNNLITVTLDFADVDMTSGQVIKAKAQAKQSFTFDYKNDTNTKLLLSRYGTQTTAAGDSAAVGMWIGFGGTYNTSTSRLEPILGILESDAEYNGTLASTPTNVSGTIWSVSVTNLTANGQSVPDATYYFDSSLGKMFRGGVPMTSLAKSKAGDEIKFRLGYNLARSRYEISKGILGVKRVYVPASALNKGSITATGDPITFKLQISDNQALTNLGKTSPFTMTVKLPLSANAFSFDQKTKTGKDLSMSSMVTTLSGMASTSYIYIDGYFDSGTDTFYVDELFLDIQ